MNSKLYISNLNLFKISCSIASSSLKNCTNKFTSVVNNFTTTRKYLHQQHSQSNHNKKEISIYISKLKDPWKNLAIENWLLYDQLEFKFGLFLYRNDPCVVLGKHQNPFTECRLDLMQKDNIHLLRRRSGGGTVYHDLGNANFCAIMPRESFHRGTYSKVISNALLELDIPNQINHRFDIMVDGNKKIRSAYKVVKDRAYHHGTMLIDTEPHKIKQYLYTRQKNIQGGGTPSVRAPEIGRLRDYSFTVDFPNFVDAAIKSFVQFHQVESVPKIIEVDESFFISNEKIASYYEETKSMEWIYGLTPKFEQRIKFNVSHTIVVQVVQGKVYDMNFERDTQPNSLLETSLKRIEGQLKGQYYGLPSFMSLKATFHNEEKEESSPSSTTMDILDTIMSELK